MASSGMQFDGPSTTHRHFVTLCLSVDVSILVYPVFSEKEIQSNEKTLLARPMPKILEDISLGSILPEIHRQYWLAMFGNGLVLNFELGVPGFHTSLVSISAITTAHGSSWRSSKRQSCRGLDPRHSCDLDYWKLYSTCNKITQMHQTYNKKPRNLKFSTPA